MRMILYAMLIASISNGCTTINMINSRLSQLMYVDSAFEKQTKSFVEEAKKRGHRVNMSKLTMIFGKTNTKEDSGTIGTCQNIDGYPLIVIDREYWDLCDAYEHEELIYHELGHCLLNRDHCEMTNKDGGSVSLMEPNMLGSQYYKANRENLIDELFNPHEGCRQIGSNADGIHLRIH